MPRDPRDVSTHGNAKQARRIAALEDQKDPIRLRTGTGPAGAEGKEGPTGKEGPPGASIVVLSGQINGEGKIIQSVGSFTAEKTGTGLYTVKYTELSAVPIVVCNHATSGFGFATPVSEGKTSFKVEVRNSAGTLANESWSFILTR
jgi:hypothetical protein